MTPETANAIIRVRPLRFGFVIRPDDRPTLRHVLEINTCLWGGIFNFIIPLFQRTPQRYGGRPIPGPTAKELVGGLLEAFEPDFLVEAQPGITSQLSFPKERIIGMNDLFRRDEHGRGGLGLTLTDVCRRCIRIHFGSFRGIRRELSPRHPIGNPRIEDARSLALAAHHAKLPAPEVAKRMTGWRTQGKTLRAIATDLNRLNIRPPRGRQWYASSVRNQLP